MLLVYTIGYKYRFILYIIKYRVFNSSMWNQRLRSGILEVLEFARPGQSTPHFLRCILLRCSFGSFGNVQSHNPHVATLQWYSYYWYAGICSLYHDYVWTKSHPVLMKAHKHSFACFTGATSKHPQVDQFTKGDVLSSCWTDMNQQGTSVSSTAFTSPLRWVSFNSCKSRGPQWSKKCKIRAGVIKISKYK